MRYELPPGLTPEEVRAIEAALRQYFGRGGGGLPAPWALAGRAEALRLGAHQVRQLSARPWAERLPFSRRGFSHRAGRGDTR